MVFASTRTAAADALASLAIKPATSSNKTNSFAEQLTGAIGGARQAAGQNSGKSQLLVGAAAQEAAAAAAGDIPTMLGMGPAEGAVPVSRVTAPAAKVPVATPAATAPQPVASTPVESEADAYWATQPAAVQVLRAMPDDDAKEKLALSLANQGYSIDTQIMVWNWDPQMTMQVRENQGYAWVPSFGQNNIPIGPGLSMPGVPDTYSPNSPPPGSIAVSTAFAVGTVQNPLVQVDQITT